MYSLIATISIFTSTYLAEYIAKKEKLKFSDRLWEITLMVLLLGVIGARLYHVVDFFEFYKANPLQIFNFRAGGLALYGGLIGGLLGGFVASKIYSFRLAKFLDLMVIVLPLGQAIGRWGNYFNYELYGKPYEGFLKLYIPIAHRQNGFEQIAYYHPLFFYESFLNLLLFFVLYFLWTKKKFKIGSLNLLYIYIFGYGLIRYTLEPLRINTWAFSGAPVASMISILFVLVGVIGFFSNILIMKGKK